MNESEPINNLENEITFLQSMADLVERAADMRQAKVPMTVYISSLGVYVCNSKAVHNNSQKAVEAQNSTSNNISSEEICNNIMEVLLIETGIFAHCDLSRRLEIKNIIKSVIDCKLSHLL